MNKNSKIYVAGNRGLVGSAIVRELTKKGFTNLVFTPHAEYDLTNQQTVRDFFEKEKPEYVFFAAAKVGGIVANNTYRADFIYQNLQIQNNQLLKNIEQAATDASGALKSYYASQKAVDSYKEAFTYTEEKFNVGVVNTIDYNDAKNKLIKAESDMLKAKYNYEFKKVILNFYQGNPLTINK